MMINHNRFSFSPGMVQTYQRGDQKPYGISYKVAPLTTETVLNDRTCFEVNGTHDGEVLAQAIIPDLSEFTVGTIS